MNMLWMFFGAVVLVTVVEGIRQRCELLEELEDEAWDFLANHVKAMGITNELVHDAIDDTLASYYFKDRFFSRNNSMPSMYPDLISRFEYAMMVVV